VGEDAGEEVGEDGDDVELHRTFYRQGAKNAKTLKGIVFTTEYTEGTEN
jgi:hypothetical protein